MDAGVMSRGHAPLRRPRLSDETTRRALAAVPTSVVVFFATLLFTASPAWAALRDDAAGAVVWGGFDTVVAATVVLVVVVSVLSVVVGRRFDLFTQRFADSVAVALFGILGLAVGLVAALAIAVVVGGRSQFDVWGSLMLAVVIPAVVSGAATRVVVAETARSWTQFALAVVVAMLATAGFLWVTSGLYA